MNCPGGVQVYTQLIPGIDAANNLVGPVDSCVASITPFTPGGTPGGTGPETPGGPPETLPGPGTPGGGSRLLVSSPDAQRRLRSCYEIAMRK